MMNIDEPPPIFPSIEEDLKKYLLCPENLPIHNYERNQEFWPRVANPIQALYTDNSPVSSTLKVQRNADTGEIIGLKEVPIQNAGANAKNSMLLTREPAPPSEATCGNASYIPFWPGSFPRPKNVAVLPDLEETNLLETPPGFSHGLSFGGAAQPCDTFKSSDNVINLLDLVHKEQDLSGVFKPIEEEKPEQTTNNEILPEEDEVLSKLNDLTVVLSTPNKFNLTKSLHRTKWAELLDTSIPVKNFHEKIPDMAFNFNFELDTFQKLAILELEKHNHVFVAAPTSAGKTVVAQYAIALSEKHRTKTIYTSPIKALSNQKYRDFKKDFDDVGLITGDFQVNQTASCLIMTTEILRSMLYCGSDTTRDVEYVIFDEVHYVNDPERGHVWEQVLILLPANVCIIMLSATVPNSMEFAEWLGQTHKRKVYVISTDQRPVPLEHFLYVCSKNDTSHKKYKLLDGVTWHREEYFEAKNEMEKLKSKGKPFQQSQPFNLVQQKRMWTVLIKDLKDQQLLPAVAFTFSRQKCDMIAASLVDLLHIDFTTKDEKRAIARQFDKYIQCLKEVDWDIPQIKNMKEILCKGIGVHHSGILPIVKEIIEIMFQEGKIKLLFATETFAMGVNMPARTVVFESWKKHDGKERRELQPAEYIQMAGRAGRRSHDTKGTVFIICQTDFPEEHVLRTMMLGKPSSLVSQFRLTYGMVLSLLRVESLSVEGMMSRSFKEADHQKNLSNVHKQIEELKIQLEELKENELNEFLDPLVKYFFAVSNYINFRHELLPKVFLKPKVLESLEPGRVILLTIPGHINKLGFIVEVLRSKELAFKVLVLTDNSNESNPYPDNPEKAELWCQLLAFSTTKVFASSGTTSHTVLRVKFQQMYEITSVTLQLKWELVLQDWEKRQIERFRDDPPSKSCLQAIQTLQKLTNEFNSGKPKYLHFIRDLKINDICSYNILLEYDQMKDHIANHVSSTQIPNFTHHMESVFTRKFVEMKIEQLQYSISDESLLQYPDMMKKITLLRHFGYVNSQNTVELKGKVACEIGMCELLITELVLRNILTKLKPAEVAALLSPLIFQKRGRNEVELEDIKVPPALRTAIDEMINVHQDVATSERENGIDTFEFQEDLNFGLIDVVYEWASGTSFTKIMRKATVQEGIIVRCIQQLNDIICDVKKAARIIGDSELQTKMEEASTAIKRDIVFAASLYTTET